MANISLGRTLLGTLLAFLNIILSCQAAEKPLNLAPQYSSDFHIPFSLIAFTTIVLVLAAFGVSIAMWNLDPGRDSIIYRMTSQRKKDQ